MKTVIDFQKMKDAHEKITMLTCYDYWSANILAKADIDCILVGDSASMVMHGCESTVPATMAMMEWHVKAVARGAPNKFIIGDMPFLSFRKGLPDTMRNVEKLMQAGSHAVKLEGARGNLANIEHIVTSGIPVMGHIGLTPQSVFQLGGHKLQGTSEQAQQELMQAAKDLENAGCFAIVLECIPAPLAARITHSLRIPTIGVGAGQETSGQVLVLQDMLGMNDQFMPKFLKTYLKGFELIRDAVNEYTREVKEQKFPRAEHCYKDPTVREVCN